MEAEGNTEELKNLNSVGKKKQEVVNTLVKTSMVQAFRRTPGVQRKRNTQKRVKGYSKGERKTQLPMQRNRTSGKCKAH